MTNTHFLLVHQLHRMNRVLCVVWTLPWKTEPLYDTRVSLCLPAHQSQTTKPYSTPSKNLWMNKHRTTSCRERIKWEEIHQNTPYKRIPFALFLNPEQINCTEFHPFVLPPFFFTSSMYGPGQTQFKPDFILVTLTPRDCILTIKLAEGLIWWLMWLVNWVYNHSRSHLALQGITMLGK